MQKYIIHILFLSSLILCLAGCSRDLSPSAYLSWMAKDNNPLMASTSSEEISLKLQYQPSEAMALKAYGPDVDEIEDWDKVIEEYDRLWYFRLKIEQPQNRERDQNTEYQKFLSFGMQKNMALVQGQDTLPCVLFHRESIHGVTPFESYMLAFERTENLAQYSFLFKGKALDISDILLPLNTWKLEEIPTLATK